jgi:hypothetical protein
MRLLRVKVTARDLCYYCATDRPRKGRDHVDANGNPAGCTAWAFRAKGAR